MRPFRALATAKTVTEKSLVSKKMDNQRMRGHDQDGDGGSKRTD